MHDGCTGSFGDGKAVVDKIRSMGFNTRPMPMEITIKCIDCKNNIYDEIFYFDDTRETVMNPNWVGSKRDI